MTRGGRDRGAVAVVMLAVLVVGLVLATGALRLGGAMVGRARAATAADAAALAAGDALALGHGPVAAAVDARDVAQSNDARLVSCTCAGTEATVVVEVDLPPFVLGGGTARARARAEVVPECALVAEACD